MSYSLDVDALRPVLRPRFFEYDGCVFVRGVASERLYRARRTGKRSRQNAALDRTGIEALENHLHLLDVIAHGHKVRKGIRAFRTAELIGPVIAHVWRSELGLAFPGQVFRIYYTRHEEPIVRCHRVYRGEHPWLDEAKWAREVARGHVLVLETAGRAA